MIDKFEAFKALYRDLEGSIRSMGIRLGALMDRVSEIESKLKEGKSKDEKEGFVF